MTNKAPLCYTCRGETELKQFNTFKYYYCSKCKLEVDSWGMEVKPSKELNKKEDKPKGVDVSWMYSDDPLNGQVMDSVAPDLWDPYRKIEDCLRYTTIKLGEESSSGAFREAAIEQLKVLWANYKKDYYRAYNWGECAHNSYSITAWDRAICSICSFEFVPSKHFRVTF